MMVSHIANQSYIQKSKAKKRTKYYYLTYLLCYHIDPVFVFINKYSIYIKFSFSFLNDS
jgi:hypothetical protein